MSRKFTARPARLVQYRDKSGARRWRVTAMNGAVLGDSGQGYSRATDARSGAVACALAILKALAPECLRRKEDVRLQDPIKHGPISDFSAAMASRGYGPNGRPAP